MAPGWNTVGTPTLFYPFPSWAQFGDLATERYIFLTLGLHVVRAMQEDWALSTQPPFSTCWGTHQVDRNSATSQDILAVPAWDRELCHYPPKYSGDHWQTLSKDGYSLNLWFLRGAQRLTVPWTSLQSLIFWGILPLILLGLLIWNGFPIAFLLRDSCFFYEKRGQSQLHCQSTDLWLVLF